MKKRIVEKIAAAILISTLLAGCAGGNAGAGAKSAKTEQSEAAGVSEAAGTSESAGSGDAAASADSSTGFEKGKSISGYTYRVMSRRNHFRASGVMTSYDEYSYEANALSRASAWYTLEQGKKDPESQLKKTYEAPEYTFDENARTVTSHYPGDDYNVVYQFDDQQRLISIYTEDTKTQYHSFNRQFEYDATGHLVKQFAVDHLGNRVDLHCTYEYDASGNLASCKVLDRYQGEVEYDGEGYPVKFTQYDRNHEVDNWDAWVEYEYEDVTVPEELPEFMGSLQQWIIADVAYNCD